MTTISERGASTLWIMLLTIASTVTTLALACATPFPALAALAALHMKPRDGTALMIVSWIASQAVGFGIHSYPHDASTLGWAAALGMAAVVSVLGAYAVIERLQGAFAVRLIAVYVGAYIAFKLTVLICALALGGAEMAMAPAVLAEQFVRNGAILLGLLALYHALVAIGVPAASPRRAAA